MNKLPWDCIGMLVSQYTHHLLLIIIQSCKTVFCRTPNYIFTFFIYVFSRRFYPKRLTVYSGYTCFVSTCVPWELNPQPLRCLRNALPLSHRNIRYFEEFKPSIQLKHDQWLSSSKKDKKHHRSSPYVSCTIFQFFWNCTMAFYTEQTQMSVEIHWYLPFLHLNLIRVCIFTHAVTRCAAASSTTQQNLHEFEGFITRCSGILHSD